jgi:2-amino-4-hydroxy-6-hydroxymethyldihydropteridine diphosphokinase
MTRSAVRAYVGLGSNLDDPLQQVHRGLAALARLPESRLIARSRLFRSEPIGPPDQPRYINAAALLHTALPADELLSALHDIELRQGRQRVVPWGPRTLDLDLLLYGSQLRRGVAPLVPHPRLHERAFVLMPLLDLDPELEIPGLGRADALLARLDSAGVTPVDREEDDG